MEYKVIAEKQSFQAMQTYFSRWPGTIGRRKMEFYTEDDPIRGQYLGQALYYYKLDAVHGLVDSASTNFEQSTQVLWGEFAELDKELFDILEPVTEHANA